MALINNLDNNLFFFSDYYLQVIVSQNNILNQSLTLNNKLLDLLNSNLSPVVIPLATDNSIVTGYRKTLQTTTNMGLTEDGLPLDTLVIPLTRVITLQIQITNTLSTYYSLLMHWINLSYTFTNNITWSLISQETYTTGLYLTGLIETKNQSDKKLSLEVTFTEAPLSLNLSDSEDRIIPALSTINF